MKRALLLLPFLYLAGPSVISQTLESTTWSLRDAQSTVLGNVQFESGIISFQEAGSTVYLPWSTYTLIGDVIEVVDMDGCTDPGTYTYMIQDDTLHFTLQVDPCTERITSFTMLHWVSVTTDIGETDAVTILNVHPNPSTGVIEIRNETPEAMWLMIHDLSGRIVHQVRTTGMIVQLDLGHLARGKYVITGLAGEKIHRQKLILE